MAAVRRALARWQQVKAAKMVSALCSCPLRGHNADDSLIHRDILHGHYLFENARFRCHNDDQRIPRCASFASGGSCRASGLRYWGVTVRVNPHFYESDGEDGAE